jgi:hypothetical protein
MTMKTDQEVAAIQKLLGSQSSSVLCPACQRALRDHDVAKSEKPIIDSEGDNPPVPLQAVRDRQ